MIETIIYALVMLPMLFIIHKLVWPVFLSHSLGYGTPEFKSWNEFKEDLNNEDLSW